jgi:hypothetical protein
MAQSSGRSPLISTCTASAAYLLTLTDHPCAFPPADLMSGLLALAPTLSPILSHLLALVPTPSAHAAQHTLSSPPQLMQLTSTPDDTPTPYHQLAVTQSPAYLMSI